jgi:hypothetical protein
MYGASSLAACSSLQVCPFVSVLFLPVEKQSGKYVCVNVCVVPLSPPLSLSIAVLFFVFKNAFRELEQEGNGPMNCETLSEIYCKNSETRRSFGESARVKSTLADCTYLCESDTSFFSVAHVSTIHTYLSYR